MKEPKKLKRAVIKEELVELTNDPITAIILNQFIYWTERVRDFDKFISEEAERAKSENIETGLQLQNGWIYKKTTELGEECMLKMSEVTVRAHIKKLIDLQLLKERNNPLLKWDKTLQYRLDMQELITRLNSLGYALEGYRIQADLASKLKNLASEQENLASEQENLASEQENLASEQENLGAIPETTSETTTETTTDITPPPTTPSAELSDVSNANAKAFAKREICDASSFKEINTDSDAKQDACVPNQHALSTTTPPIAPPPPPPPKSPPVEESQPPTDPFDEFWSLYPRKVDKKKASAKYKKLVKHHTIIMEGLRKHLELWKNRDIEHIPHPTTWLNGERWNDELPASKPQQQTHTPQQTPTTPSRDHKPEPKETLSSVFESSVFTKKSDEEKREFLKKYRERGCEIPSNLNYLLS